MHLEENKNPPFIATLMLFFSFPFLSLSAVGAGWVAQLRSCVSSSTTERWLHHTHTHTHTHTSPMSLPCGNLLLENQAGNTTSHHRDSQSVFARLSASPLPSIQSASHSIPYPDQYTDISITPSALLLNTCPLASFTSCFLSGLTFWKYLWHLAFGRWGCQWTLMAMWAVDE